MGKSEDQRLYLEQQEREDRIGGSSGLCCGGCSAGLGRRIEKELSFRCFFVLILSLGLLVSGIFWVVPLHRSDSGFEAKDAVKKSAVVRASFQLQRPVSQLIPRIGRLEYDIFEEIGLPDTKMAILSMHQPTASNWTRVVFGILPDPISAHINPVSLSVLKSSLIEVFLKQSNLTLTASIFGQPQKFEILEFPGGVTVIPPQSAPLWQVPQIMFNFTLNNSISEIQDNFVEFKEQLKLGLGLKSYENVLVQLTNADGSTAASHVVVEASIMSDLGSIVPPRLKQLAQAITGSPAENLGLDNTVFGEVKSISLSSTQKGSLNAYPPISPPASPPQPSDLPYTTLSPPPTYSPAPSPNVVRHIHTRPPPCPYTRSSVPPSSSPTSHHTLIAPAPSSPRAAAPSLPPVGPVPELAPIPVVSYGSTPRHNNEGVADGSVSPSPAPTSSSLLAASPFVEEVWLLCFTGLFAFYNLCWWN